MTVERSALDELLTGAATPEALTAARRLTISGEQGVLMRLAGLIDPPDPAFAIVTP